MGKKKKLKRQIKCLSRNLNFVMKDMLAMARNVDFCQQQIDAISEAMLERGKTINVAFPETIDKALFEQKVLKAHYQCEAITHRKDFNA